MPTSASAEEGSRAVVEGCSGFWTSPAPSQDTLAMIRVVPLVRQLA